MGLQLSRRGHGACLVLQQATHTAESLPALQRLAVTIAVLAMTRHPTETTSAEKMASTDNNSGK